MNTVQPRSSTNLVLRTFRGRNLRALVLALAVASPVALAQEAGLQHQYLMRGQVLEVKDKTVTVCVGSADGAKVGQDMNVVRHERIHRHKEPGPSFRRADVGRVKITTVFDGHYAEATVVDGDVRVNDTVEIQRN